MRYILKYIWHLLHQWIALQIFTIAFPLRVPPGMRIHNFPKHTSTFLKFLGVREITLKQNGINPCIIHLIKFQVFPNWESASPAHSVSHPVFLNKHYGCCFLLLFLIRTKQQQKKKVRQQCRLGLQRKFWFQILSNQSTVTQIFLLHRVKPLNQWKVEQGIQHLKTKPCTSLSVLLNSPVKLREWYKEEFNGPENHVTNCRHWHQISSPILVPFTVTGNKKGTTTRVSWIWEAAIRGRKLNPTGQLIMTLKGWRSYHKVKLMQNWGKGPLGRN